MPCRRRLGGQSDLIRSDCHHTRIATINTDGWSSYARLPMLGYRHQVSVISAGSDPAHVVMPRVHKVVSLLRRWLMGTHQGGIQRQHLDSISAAKALTGWSGSHHRTGAGFALRTEQAEKSRKM
jgi:hypothetical protein